MRKLFVILSLLAIYNVSYPQLGYKYHEKFISLNVKDSSICFIKTKTNINELGDNIASKCHKIMDDNYTVYDVVGRVVCEGRTTNGNSNYIRTNDNGLFLIRATDDRGNTKVHKIFIK